MPAVARITDIGKTELDSYITDPVTLTPVIIIGAGPIISGSLDVFVNNLGVARLGDTGTNAPGYPTPTPGIFTISGNCSDKFFVNDKKVAYAGSETTHPGQYPNPGVLNPGKGSIQQPCSLDTFTD